MVSSNVTFLDMKTLCVIKSRHQEPLCLREYPRTHKKGACGKFVLGGSYGVGKTETSEDAHVIIDGVLAKKAK